MKSEKGITLTSLVIYIIIFSAVLALVGSLTNFINGNIKNLNADSISSEEFNKFNTYFVKDIKESKKVVAEEATDKTEITFDNGSKYTYVKSENAIYKEAVKIARNIIKFNATVKEENNKKLIDIEISTGTNVNKPNFEKNIKYVLKYW